ncbi:helix-turn-helix domain-containing protein [Halococcus sp. IIIV-5B]|uniref:helix-turn-helix domain-containing protein n=1 Tax=Halococcus sp. IIIV-5B TaxID=2321230 RepID=UPI000E733BF8|nr:helix-turn-helix domain-containing protein [Halococcus sp. IIIV-5B]RJT07208.1 bacterio-opsin activator [Halococcus sp. IIIV-5B]
MVTRDGAANGSRTETGTELTLDVWHPECWTLHVTEDTAATLLGHGLYETTESVYGLFTVSAESLYEVDAALNEIQTSPLTEDILEMDQTGQGTRTAADGTATRGFLAEWGAETGENIVGSLVTHGFVPHQTYRMHRGREQWSVVTTMEREMVQEELADVRAEMDADIRVQRISSRNRRPSGAHQLDVLSPRQREVFELACRRDYYDWPRNVSATDLAEELDITKATVTEHLRKAESRLFDSFG